MQLPREQLWAFLTGKPVSDKTRRAIVAQLSDESTFESRIVAELGARSRGLAEGQIDLASIAMRADSLLEQSEISEFDDFVASVNCRRYARSLGILSTLAIVVFWLFWGAMLSAFIHPVFGWTYCVLELVVAIGMQCRGLTPYSGTFWEAIVGAFYLGVLTLLPAFAMGEEPLGAISGVTIILGFFGSRMGIARGFGLRTKLQQGQMTLLRVMTQCAYLAYAYVGVIIAGMGSLLIVTLILGVHSDDRYGEIYLLRWSIMFTLLASLAGAIKTDVLRCSLREFAIMSLVETVPIVVAYILICWHLGDALLDWQFAVVLLAFIPSIGGRIALVDGFATWWTKKKNVFLGTARMVETVLVALVFAAGIHYSAELLGNLAPVLNTYRDSIILTSIIAGLVVGELRLHRRVMPRVIRTVFAEVDSTNPGMRQFASSIAKLPQFIGIGLKDALMEIAVCYRGIAASQFSPVS